MELALIPIDTRFCKSPSQKLAQGLGESKTYINPTLTLHMINMRLKFHTLQLDPNTFTPFCSIPPTFHSTFFYDKYTHKKTHMA